MFNRCLGIVADLHSLTAVLIEQQGEMFVNQRELEILAPPDSPNSPLPAMIDSLCQTLASGDEPLPPAVLALDSRSYQTQLYHSQFRDLKQIRQTLRFDVEDSFALEGDELAASFQILPASSEGADLTVYSAKRQQLQQWLDVFHNAGLDPLAAQPDIEAWYQYLLHFETLPANQPLLLLGILRDTCYLLVLNPDHQMILARTFLFCPDQPPEQSLRVELHRTLSALPQEQQPAQIYSHPGNVPAKWLACLSDTMNLKSQPLQQRNLTHAMAMGAAAQWLAGPTPADFRADGLKPLSLQKAWKKSLYILSASVSALLLVMLLLTALYNHRYQSIAEQAQIDLQQIWKETYPTQKPPRTLSSIPQKLKTQAAALKKTGSFRPGQNFSGSAGNVLLFVVNLLDEMPKPFDIWIEQLQIDIDSANMTGSVPSLRELVLLGESIQKKDSPLEIVNWDFVLQQSANRTQGQGPSRRNFNLPIRLKKAEGADSSERKKR